MGGNDLGSGKIGSLMLRMSIPTIAAQLVNALYNVVDRIYIGHIPEEGELALAGLGITFPIIMLVTAVQCLISVGGSTQAAVAMGAGDQERAQKTFGGSAVLLTAGGALLTVLFQVFRDPILLLFGASEATLGYASDYLQIYLCGTVFTMLGGGLNAFIAAQGFSMAAMVTTLIGAGCNILLDPLMIFTWKIGVRGAALATVISQLLSAVWVLLFFLRGRGWLRLRRETLRVEMQLMLPALAIGFSSFVMQATECLQSIAFNASLQRYGGDLAVGAFSIASSVLKTVALVLAGFTQGGQPIVSYNYGSGDLGRVRQAAYRMVLVSALIGAGSSLLCELLPEQIVKLFNDSPELVEFTARALRIYMIGILFLGIQHGSQHVLVALGQTKLSLFLAALRKLFLLIPLVYLLPLLMEDAVTAILIAEPISDTIAGAVSGILFAIRFRKLMRAKGREIRCESSARSR